MRIDSKNRTIINIFGAPLIIFSISFNQITFSILIFIIFIISMYEYISLIKENSKLTLYRLILGILWISSIFFFLLIYDSINISKFFILLIFISVWVTDSMAFVMGKKFGKKKIFPNISPNKTWVGSISGLLFSILFLLLIYFNFDIVIIKDSNGNILTTTNIWPANFQTIDIILLGFITGFFSQFGDFLESYFKRKLNVKDSSKLLLGHGGFLDRFDSMFTVGIITYFYLILTGYYYG